MKEQKVNVRIRMGKHRKGDWRRRPRERRDLPQDEVGEPGTTRSEEAMQQQPETDVVLPDYMVRKYIGGV